MRYGIFSKMSKMLVNHYPEYVSKYLASRTKKEKIKSLNKGFRLLNPVVRLSGEDGDNFRKNLVTALIEFDRIKIPRIAKLRLMKAKGRSRVR